MDYSLTDQQQAQGALGNDERASDLQTLPDTLTKGSPSDPSLNPSSGYFQWNLAGTWGIRADQAWQDYTGEGVRVAILDDGFEYTNSELAANYNTAIDFDTTGSNDHNAFAGAYDNHGTAVAGVIGADDNGSSLVGVAYDAELMGIRLDFYGGIQAIREGLQYAYQHGTDVLNNSWGYPATFVDNPYIPYSDGSFAAVQNDLINAVNLGRDGLGMSVVFAAGNHRFEDQDVNNHMLQSSPYTIAVGGTDKNGNLFDYSTPGAAILTSAPAENIYTVDKEGSGGYVSGDVVGISGTSFSAPTITGVIALMYEANPELGYRDVQDILALASRKANQTSWQTNGSSHWNGGGMHFSHDYGFGLIDAYAAVRLAENWGEQKTYANMQAVSASSANNIYLADLSTNEFTFNITENLIVEHAQLTLNLPHDKAGDLVITLISPEGTQSTLVDRLDFGSYRTDAVGWYQGIHTQMDTVANWGELSAGTWTLRIEDQAAGNDGYLQGAVLTLLGSEATPDENFYFTDEFAGATITDADGGVDTLNLSAVRGNAVVDLTGAQVTRFAGHNLNFTDVSAFENITAGDGNDILVGNAADNIILAGRGDDTLTGTSGNDTLDGQQGDDSVSFTASLANFVVEILDTVTARLVDTVTNFGTNIIRNVEHFLFTDHAYSWSQLVDHAGGIPVTEDVGYSIRAGRYWSNFTSDARGDLDLQASDLRYRGADDYVHVTRETDSMILTRLTDVRNPVTMVKMDLDRAFDLTAVNFPYAYITFGGSEDSSLVFNDLYGGTLETGAGHDTIDLAFSEMVRKSAKLIIHTGEGNDVVSGVGGSGNVTSLVYGGGGDDVIHATAGKNVLFGEAGDDQFTLDSGFAKIYGGAGDDSGSVIGDGRVYFFGEDGNDSFTAGAAHDYLKGDAGNDTLHGGDGNDKIYGDDGDDILHGDGGNDVLIGGAGDDQLYGGDGIDKLYGFDGNDQIYGGADNDKLYGYDGDDLLNGGDGDDYLNGMNGMDMLDGGTGRDVLLGGNGDDMLFGGGGNDKIYGQNDNDSLFGENGEDILIGGNGDDQLYGGAGNDVLYGQKGADTFHFDLVSVDTVKDFNAAQGDVLDISSLLSGYSEGVSDINDFVIFNVISRSQTEILVNSDGAGNDFQAVGLIVSNFTNTSVDDLHASGALVAG